MKYMVPIKDDLDKIDCPICCEKLSEPSDYGEGRPDAHEAIKLSKCGHQFHKLCLLQMYQSTDKVKNRIDIPVFLAIAVKFNQFSLKAFTAYPKPCVNCMYL